MHDKQHCNIGYHEQSDALSLAQVSFFNMWLSTQIKSATLPHHTVPLKELAGIQKASHWFAIHLVAGTFNIFCTF
jgi:hypothetical protein